MSGKVRGARASALNFELLARSCASGIRCSLIWRQAPSQRPVHLPFRSRPLACYSAASLPCDGGVTLRQVSSGKCTAAVAGEPGVATGRTLRAP